MTELSPHARKTALALAEAAKNQPSTSGGKDDFFFWSGLYLPLTTPMRLTRHQASVLLEKAREQGERELVEELERGVR